MEIKILNSILFKELMPWTFDAKGTKAINEKIKKVGSKEPTTEAELVQQLQVLLADYSDLSKWLTKQNTKGTSTLKNHCYAIDFPAYSDAVSKFYNAVISLETLRVFNAFNTKMQKYSKKVDIVYHTTIALKNIKALTVNTVKEIKERGFEEAPTEQNNLSHFVLQLLRQHLTVLFFDIQELSIASIDSPTSIENFYLIDLNLPKSAANEVKQISKNIDITNEILPNKIPLNKNTTSSSPKFSFGWKNGKVSQLQSLFDDLCVDYNFLDEERTTVEVLVKLLTAKEISLNETDIYLGCQTTQFVYIMDNISKHFQRLTPTNIEKSKCFWSKAVTNKESTLITAENYFKSRKKNKMKTEIKDNILDTIQKYFP
jgi:hypothetical protein